MSKTIIPVILSGGSGTRLWPLSREQYPKQFLPLAGSRSLLQQTVERCLAAGAALGHLVTFGIKAEMPETEFGWIRPGAAIDGVDGAYQVEELQRFEPALLAAVTEAVAGRASDLDSVRLAADAFKAAPSVSIDDVIFARTGRAATVPCSIGWSDVGSWSALHEVVEKDGDGNATRGDVILRNCQGSYVRTDGVLTAVLGLSDVVVVATSDAILVAHKDAVQDVKGVVQKLKADSRKEAESRPRVYRPLGYYQSVHAGDRFQVKRITVKPGHKLSLQKHFHCAEHWILVNGTALVTRDGEQILVREKESTYLPLGAVHRLENPGKVPLNLIEVQSGSYLGEDDIVRLEDTYGRA
ncbi:sugar phosphate nucleotidyltransferase [Niveispirillum sp.]|uniref:sugar phosphate nucleotidyltransferase n=1 Tax=Niveispirillum sp. TaxID=1917217 RepID=UPI001B4C84A9|nr:sugar phosphate nucleotidyltransferase [Niveispirillum sp.]MBP7339879.1 cupin domain-containing protein [Niveispirillum sp.]